ncbi:hypothetical protein AAG570_010638 [Ranatra chinensis]|uniref:Uncharacterized protein n=1 Tax=Ranatra chinensis TaxID=642074 RepID=A0ABD0YN64_9HEMI
MRNVTGVIINNCDHVIFHDSAFASTGAFNLHIMSVNVLELKANSMLGANLQKVSISNVNALALEQGSVRQGYFDDIVLDSVNIPNLPNVGSGEAIRIRKSMTLKNVTIGIMMASAVKSTFLGDNTTLFMENVTVEKIAPSAVNLVADFIDVKGCTFGPSTQGFILEGKQRVSMSMNSMTRENQNDFMNIKAPFINMSDNIISLPLVFLGETVKPAGKFAKLIFNSNKIRDTTFMVV